MKGQYETDRQLPAYPCETCGQRDGYCDWKACERHGRWFAVYWGNVRRIAQGLRRRRDVREQRAAQQNLAALAGLAGQAVCPAAHRRQNVTYGAAAGRRGMDVPAAQGILPVGLAGGGRQDPTAYGVCDGRAAEQERRA